MIDPTLPPVVNPAPPARGVCWRTVLLMTGLLVAGAIVFLRIEGRIWWCKLGDLTPFADAVNEHNSQHLFDAYTASHVIHGMLFYGIFWLFRRQIGAPLRFFWSVLLETAWEVFENTPFVIERYRSATASLNYTGDSLLNTLADILSAVLGYFVARRLGLWWTMAAIIALEIGTLLWIRDNLTLNVLMLLYPIEAIKQWQGRA